jgi:hypothetical protein
LREDRLASNADGWLAALGSAFGRQVAVLAPMQRTLCLVGKDLGAE